MERQLIADYENTVAELLETLTEDNHDLAVKIASIPEQIRGYGHVKEDHFEKARACEADLLASWRAGNREKQAA
jgi:indolepyruvate ferredoxin oxidoreductase